MAKRSTGVDIIDRVEKALMKEAMIDEPATSPGGTGQTMLTMTANGKAIARFSESALLRPVPTKTSHDDGGDHAESRPLKTRM